MYMSLEIEITDVKNSLQRIETAIAGDKNLGTKGLVNHIEDQEKRLTLIEEYTDQQKIRNAKMIGFATAAGVIGGHGVWVLVAKFFNL